MSRESSPIHHEVLPNGLVVITEPLPHVRSVSVGIWVTAGSRREPAELNGISHFIEHMVFKGTAHRSAEQIARAVDSVGGMLDAFTAKEMTCFNAKVLDEHLSLAFDILSDMVLHPLFAEDDVTREKSVVLEEIKMDEDNPEYLVHEVFTQNFWRDHPLGRPILGTRDTVRHFSRAAASRFFHRWYAPNNIVLTAAGNLEHGRLLELVTKSFGHLKPVEDEQTISAPEPHARITTRTKRELEQVHLCIGVPSHPIGHEQRYAVSILNNLLGGGMSSRLFQNIRERQGLAYAVFSELNPYRDAGMLTVYAGTGRETAERVVRLVMDEFCRLKKDAVSEEELRRGKDHLKGSLLLALESTSAHMSNLARQEIYFGRFYTPDQIIAAIERVTRDEVQQVARQFFRPEQIGVTVLGNPDGLKLTRDHLSC